MNWKPVGSIGWEKKKEDIESKSSVLVVLDDEIITNDNTLTDGKFFSEKPHSDNTMMAYKGFQELLQYSKFKALGFFHMPDTDKNVIERIKEINKWVSSLEIINANIYFLVDSFWEAKNEIDKKELGKIAYRAIPEIIVNCSLKLKFYSKNSNDELDCFEKKMVRDHYKLYKQLPRSVKEWLEVPLGKFIGNVADWDKIKIAGAKCCKEILPPLFRPHSIHHLPGGHHAYDQRRASNVVMVKNLEQALNKIITVLKSPSYGFYMLDNCKMQEEYEDNEGNTYPSLRDLMTFTSKVLTHNGKDVGLVHVLKNNFIFDSKYPPGVKVNFSYEVEKYGNMVWFNYIPIIKGIKRLIEAFSHELESDIANFDINLTVKVVKVDPKQKPMEITASFILKQFKNKNIFPFPKQNTLRGSEDLYNIYHSFISEAGAKVVVTNKKDFPSTEEGALIITVTGIRNEEEYNRTGLPVYETA